MKIFSSLCLQGGFLELYVKHVLGCRSKPAYQVLESSKALLRHIEHDQFKTLILPAMEKAMLRNPEIVVEGWSCFGLVLCYWNSHYNENLSP